MRNTNSWPDTMSRCLKRSGTSLSRLFKRIPNLALDTSSNAACHKESPPNTGTTDDLKLWYNQLLAKVREEPHKEMCDKKLENVQQLQQAVDIIVSEGKEKMAGAQSTEEILFRFMAGIYKIKSLM